MARPSLPRVRSVAFSAFRAGSLVSVLLRSSSHSPSCRVLVCSFSSRQRAGAFARRWAARLGVSVFLRPVVPGLLWSVSIPVEFPSSRLPERGLVSVVGGLRGFVQRLASCGFAHQGVQHV